MYICMYTYTCSYIYLHIHIYMYTHIYVHIHIYTHTHIYMYINMLHKPLCEYNKARSFHLLASHISSTSHRLQEPIYSHHINLSFVWRRNLHTNALLIEMPALTVLYMYINKYSYVYALYT